MIDGQRKFWSQRNLLEKENVVGCGSNRIFGLKTVGSKEFASKRFSSLKKNWVQKSFWSRKSFPKTGFFSPTNINPCLHNKSTLTRFLHTLCTSGVRVTTGSNHTYFYLIFFIHNVVDTTPTFFSN